MGLMEETRVRIDALELVDKIRSCGARITEPDKWQQARKELAAEIEAVAAKDADLPADVERKLREQADGAWDRWEAADGFDRQWWANWMFSELQAAARVAVAAKDAELAASEQRWQERLDRVEADNLAAARTAVAMARSAAYEEAAKRLLMESEGYGYEADLILQLAKPHSDDPWPLCKTCGHHESHHENGPCKASGCPCIGFVAKPEHGPHCACPSCHDESHECPTFPECECGITQAPGAAPSPKKPLPFVYPLGVCGNPHCKECYPEGPETALPGPADQFVREICWRVP